MTLPPWLRPMPAIACRLRRSLASRRGAAAAEFAISVPVLLLLIMGAMDFGRAIDQSIRLETAARAGAQYGLIFPDDSTGIAARVTEALPGWSGFTATSSLVCSCGGGGACAAGCAQTLTVTVTRPFSAAFFLQVTTLRGQVVLRIS